MGSPDKRRGHHYLCPSCGAGQSQSAPKEIMVCPSCGDPLGQLYPGDLKKLDKARRLEDEARELKAQVMRTVQTRVDRDQNLQKRWQQRGG